jgi:calcium uniporter protein, mitochondrial
MGGYLFFLYNQREISYRSVYEMSSSRRREQLYDLKGFDRQKWQDLVDEGTELRRAIKKIAHDYNERWSMDKELDDHKAVKEIKKHEKKLAKERPKDDDTADGA